MDQNLLYKGIIVGKICPTKSMSAYVNPRHNLFMVFIG